jgi:hypothetical protein
MALSYHNDLIRSSNQMPKVIIDKGNHELYLLATLEYSEVIVLPIQSCQTICDRCSTILNSAHRKTNDPGNHIGNHSCNIAQPVLEFLAASVT